MWRFKCNDGGGEWEIADRGLGGATELPEGGAQVVKI